MNTAYSLVPTFVAGAVALASAMISAVIALYSISRGNRDRQNARSQETALSLLPRRLDAYELVWRSLFVIEQSRRVNGATADSLVEKSIWLPDELRTNLLELLLEDGFHAEKVKRVRSLLLKDAAIVNVDSAMDRLRRGEGLGDGE